MSLIGRFWADLRRLPSVDLVWLGIWSLIYLGFLLLDFLLPSFWGASVLKYVGIFLCLVYAYQKFKTDYLLILALLFTFLSDTILVWTHWELAGVYCFCFAQFFHIMRLSKSHPKFLIMYFLVVFLLFTFAILQGISPLYSIAIIYAGSLLSNVILSRAWYLRERHNFRARCAFYGFLLFLACDICVGLQHLMLDGVFPAQLLPLISYLVWFFYYPSQVFLANSSNLAEVSVAKKNTIE